MFNLKEITVRDAFEALKKNGFDHLREEWVETDENGLVIGGCVLAQAAFNLGVLPAHYDDDSNDDEQEGTLYAELNQFEVDPNSRWFREDKNLGRTIIYWNDLGIYNEETDKLDYFLPTYDDVVKMAYEVMEPHFDKVINVIPRTWEFRVNV